MLVKTEHLASGLSYPAAMPQACTHLPPALSPCLPAFPMFPLILLGLPLPHSPLAPEVESSSPLSSQLPASTASAHWPRKTHAIGVLFQFLQAAPKPSTGVLFLLLLCTILLRTL